MEALEEVLDVLTALPSSVQQTLSLLKEIEGQSNLPESRLSLLLKDGGDRTELLEQLTIMIGVEAEKIERSRKMGAIVEQHLERLEDRLLSFKKHVRDEASSGSETESEEEEDSGKRKKGCSEEETEAAEEEEEAGEAGEAEEAPPTASSPAEFDTAPMSSEAHPKPQKEKYCYCGQGSHGEMVACDNSQCNIEWFHYGCVGLQSPPAGHWLCPECQKPNN